MNRLREVHRNAKVRVKGNSNNSNQSVNARANSLVKDVIEAHGGEKQWHSFNKLTARVVTGGFLWSMKGFEIDIAPRTMTGEFRRQSVRIDPFGNQDWHMHYEPDRVVIETRSGEIMVDQLNPRETFVGHAWETPWTPAQLAYFSGYAMWTYFNLPFLLSEPGVVATEIPSIDNDGLELKGLRVCFPQTIHTHSTEQSLYFDEGRLLRRHDYEVEVAGNNPAAHLISEYSDVQGLKIPTKRRVFMLNEDGSLQSDRTVVSIDLFDFELS